MMTMAIKMMGTVGHADADTQTDKLESLQD